MWPACPARLLRLRSGSDGEISGQDLTGLRCGGMVKGLFLQALAIGRFFASSWSVTRGNAGAWPGIDYGHALRDSHAGNSSIASWIIHVEEPDETSTPVELSTIIINEPFSLLLVNA